LRILIVKRSFWLTDGRHSKRAGEQGENVRAIDGGAAQPQIVKFFLYFQVVVTMCR
jgi:hypothetical protein